MRWWLLLLLALSACSSVEAEDQWRWIRVTNNIKGWTASEGAATISMADGKFIAQLFSDSDRQLLVSLKGEIQGGKIVVKETAEGSDYSGSTYHGTLQSKRWTQFSGTTGAESIILTDGWGMIGIRRNIEK